MRVVWVLGEIDRNVNAFVEAVKLAPQGCIRIILLHSSQPLQKLLTDNDIAYSIVPLSSVHLNPTDINLAVLADHEKLLPNERSFAVNPLVVPLLSRKDYGFLANVNPLPLRQVNRFRAILYRAFARADLKIAEDLEAQSELKIRRVLVVGSGGREHAIVAKIAANMKIEKIFVAPGNGGTGSHDSRCANVSITVENVSALVHFAQSERVDLVIVGPEQPLVEGLVDAMDDIGIPCFGPTKAASVAEASKAWSKDFMARNNIQTARYETFTEFSSAKEYIERLNYRVVVKASGLAAGKGVLIPLTTAEAVEGAKSILNNGVFGDAGKEIVVEEFLEGEEVSILAFCDGFTAKGMPAAQDHKRVFDNDQGLNTGGMGAYAPTPLITPSQYQQCMAIVQQSVTAMAKEGIPFKGVLYAGFIITKRGPYVLEYNCRFGDPETQVLLPLLETDLCEVAMACVEGSLSSLDIKWKDAVACTVVIAAPGYPEAFPKGAVINGLADVRNAAVYHAGTKTATNSSIVTNGGRVLSVTGVGKNLQEAVDLSYAAVGCISFDGAHYRRDIARRGLHRPLRIGVLGSTRGSSLQPVIDAVAAGQLSATISLVISNKSNAGILERARNHGIPSMFIGALNKSREEYDAVVCDALDAAGVDIVLLVGYMRIVSPLFVRRFPMRSFNVHPSLLPDFAGGMDLEVHKAVLEAGRTKSGCTVHFVTEGVDEGPVAVQLECAVDAGDTPESLKAKVQPLEGKALIRAVELYANRAYPHQQRGNVEVITYRAAGVDIDAGEALVHRIKPFCKSTVRPGCDAELGGFGGLFDLAQAGFVADDTILVSGTDGVGTKLKIAQAVGSHKTIGIDLVAMCVNDILVCGAEPLFFLDYYATGALNVDEAADVVEGIAEGCRQAGCALIGGETAEMAGMYAKGEYDIAGFSVGAVRRSEILPRGVSSSDVLLGLLSTGVHSNGYSLVRKCVDRAGCKWSDAAPFAPGQTLGDALLTPTRIYIKALLPLIRKGLVKGMAHITGGGLLDNLPRILPPDVCAVIDMASSGWQLSPVFKWLQSITNLPQDELLRTFNNGIGMVVVVAADKVEEVTNLFLAGGEEKVFRLGALHHKSDPVLASLEITTSSDDVRVMGTLK